MSQELLKGLEETTWMILGSGFFTVLLGLPLGIYLTLGADPASRYRSEWHRLLNLLMQIMASVPYVLLMILIAPLTRWFTGTTIGYLAAMFPLTLACTPIFARLTEKAMLTVPKALLETAEAFGASTWQIIYKILLPETAPQLIQALTVTLVHLTGYTVISGALGSGGLGSIAIHQGYFALQTDYLIISVLLLFLVIQLIQNAGNYFAERRAKH